jgi:hypothetical protein
VDRPLTDVELVEAWVHARRHVGPQLDPFSADAHGLQVSDGVRLVLDHRAEYVVVVLLCGDDVWTLDGIGEPLCVRWCERHGTAVDLSMR